MRYTCGCGLNLSTVARNSVSSTSGRSAACPSKMWSTAYRLPLRTSPETLLDQTVVSGIGNIYADEALWRARLHGSRPTATLTRAQGHTVLAAVTEVMGEALAAGGTSFDALYVNINGASGYFDRSLAAYGQAGRPCRRCGTAIHRESFMNRSSYFCPRCQPRPRHPY